MSLRRFTVAAIMLLIVQAALSSAQQPPTQEPPTFRVGSEEVVMHVRFSDRIGRSVTDLRPEEITILDDGQPQKLRRLFFSEEPFDLALLLDSSVSTTEAMPQIRIQSADFASRIPEGNRLLVLSFDSEVYVDCDWTADLGKAEDAIRNIESNEKANRTVLYEAVTVAAEKKFKREAPRKAMVLYTDGIDEGSHNVSQKESLTAIEESGILVYAIQYDSRDHYRRRGRLMSGRSPNDPDWEPPVGTTGRKVGGIFVGGSNPSDRDTTEYIAQSRYDSARKYLRKVAEVGAGRYFETLTISDLANAYERIIQELSLVSTVTYVPARKARDGQYHRVRVGTTRSGVAAKTAREGYWSR